MIGILEWWLWERKEGKKEGKKKFATSIYTFVAFSRNTENVNSKTE